MWSGQHSTAYCQASTPLPTGCCCCCHVLLLLLPCAAAAAAMCCCCFCMCCCCFWRSSLWLKPNPTLPSWRLRSTRCSNGPEAHTCCESSADWHQAPRGPAAAAAGSGCWGGVADRRRRGDGAASRRLMTETSARTSTTWVESE